MKTNCVAYRQIFPVECPRVLFLSHCFFPFNVYTGLLLTDNISINCYADKTQLYLPTNLNNSMQLTDKIKAFFKNWMS